MLFEKNIFNPNAIKDERTVEVILAATERASEKLRPSDLLASAIESGEATILSTLSQALEPGSTPQDLKNIIDVYNPANKEASEFDGQKESFSTETIKVLEDFENKLSVGTEGIEEVSFELLCSCVLSHLDEDDREYLTTLDAARGIEIFQEHIKIASEQLTPLFDEGSGRLRSEEFAESCWTILEHATSRAAGLGYDRILPPHCFLALLSETEGVAEHVIRLQAMPEIGPAKVAEVVSNAFKLADRKMDPIELSQNGIGESTVRLIREAQKLARLWGAEQIDTAHLLLALLESMPSRLGVALQGSPLSIDLEKMHEHLEQYLHEVRTKVKREVAFRLPPGLLLSEDITYCARTEHLSEAVELDGYFDTLIRALYRRINNHILITGLRGVGKTTLVHELARRSAIGEIAFLKRKRFLWVDCQDIAPEDSRDKLEGIISHVAGRTDLVLVLDGLGALLRAESGANNKLVLRATLKESRVHLIGVLSNWDYEDLLSADHEILEFFTRVNVEEPNEESTIKIIKQVSAKLQDEYKVTIEEKVFEKAVILSANYIMNERLPVKVVKILRRACEDLDYEKTQKKVEKPTITEKKVIKVISEISGVPEETLAGVAEDSGFEESLRKGIIGQDEALKAVIEEIGLIKAGLSDPGKPASVMFFAGLTGVGKTELAKELAQIYSSSKHLQTYTMGNFTEAHSTSGIIGVPPGYVGYEQGGRLINDMNSDPYCVFLLDEAEKAHPDVWKPFLNLFDEGWIVDQRGVKAFADRAIFILTSNAGHETISKMSKTHKIEEIIEKVKTELSTIKHERTGQIVFPPEFLARIKRIIIFKPLDQKALEGICRKLVKNMQDVWQKKRDKFIEVPDSLIKYIAKQSSLANEKSGGKEGGRIVRKKISELIESSIQYAATESKDEYKSCNRIKLIFLPPGTSLPHTPAPTAKINVEFIVDESPDPSECVAQIKNTLKEQFDHIKDSAKPVKEIINNSINQLQNGIDNWGKQHPENVMDSNATLFLTKLHKLHEELEQLSITTKKNSQKLLKKIVDDIESEEKSK